MSSPAFVINSFIEVSQLVADFLINPLTFTATQATALITTLEALRGGIQNLPVAFNVKADLNARLTGIQTILSDFAAGTSGLTAQSVLTAVLASLELLKEKLIALHLKPCTGTLTVCFPAPFSTSCCC